MAEVTSSLIGAILLRGSRKWLRMLSGPFALGARRSNEQKYKKKPFTPKMGKNDLKCEIHALKGESGHFWEK